MVRAKLWPAYALSLILLVSIISFQDDSKIGELGSKEVSNTSGEFESQITFNLNDGEVFTETLQLNGTIINKQGNYSWKIIDMFDFDQDENPIDVVSGQYLDSITPTSEDTWQWFLSVNISQINCTCKLVIFSNNNSQELTHSSEILLYLGTESHRPFILSQTISSNKISEFNYSISFNLVISNTQSIDIDGLDDEVLFLETKFCQIRSNVCVGNWKFIDLNFSIVENIVTIHIDQNQLGVEDGYWMFEMYVKDKFLRDSNSISQILIIDNSPPVVHLSSSESIEESESVLVYAQVDDYFVGSPISLTWTITDPSGNSRGLFDYEFYHNSTIELTLNQSGYWQVHLLVRDSANFLVRENISIFVENINPRINLNLDGLTVSQGDEIILTSDSEWVLNASGSTDTTNDVDDIVFHWLINGEKITSSDAVLTSSDIDIISKTNIMLVVYDDDQFSDNISFSISISQTEDENISYVAVIFSSASIFIILTIIVFKILARRDSSSLELPKWKSKN